MISGFDDDDSLTPEDRPQPWLDACEANEAQRQERLALQKQGWGTRLEMSYKFLQSGAQALIDEIIMSTGDELLDIESEPYVHGSRGGLATLLKLELAGHGWIDPWNFLLECTIYCHKAILEDDEF